MEFQLKQRRATRQCRLPTPAQICVPVLLKPEPESATAATETVNGIYMFAVISQWAAHTSPSHLSHPLAPFPLSLPLCTILLSLPRLMNQLCCSGNCNCRPVTPQLQPATSLPLFSPSHLSPCPARPAACNQANAIRIWRRFVWRILSKNCKRHLRLDFVAALRCPRGQTQRHDVAATFPHCHCPSNAMRQPLFSPWGATHERQKPSPIDYNATPVPMPLPLPHALPLNLLC